LIGFVRLQIWSSNYDPEPTGIGPVSGVLARALATRGWEVEVVAAHPHYPEPRWGRRLLPYRELRDGIRVTRLPLWIGHESGAQRIRQEASFAAALTAALPFLGRPDVILAASPSFPALAPAIVQARARRAPLVPWLHDVLPDGASATGLVSESGIVMRGSRRLERAAYEAAEKIVVLSAAFARILAEKGVPEAKIELIYDPATRGVPAAPRPLPSAEAPRILCMGNIGFTQGMAPLVRAFEASQQMAKREARLIITGTGVAAEEARAEVRSGRVEMLGVVDDERLEQELRSATLALVSQTHEGAEFNLPSKLMNYMAYGLAVIAAVDPVGEVAQLVTESDSGWVVDSSRMDSLPRVVAQALDNRAELRSRGERAHSFAQERFSPRAFGDAFDRVLRGVTQIP
jgi:colanic acid biosynthesis glycosyl transferase WcaI